MTEWHSLEIENDQAYLAPSFMLRKLRGPATHSVDFLYLKSLRIWLDAHTFYAPIIDRILEHQIFS